MMQHIELPAVVAEKDGKPVLKVKELTLALTIPQLLHLVIGGPAPNETKGCTHVNAYGAPCIKPAHKGKHQYLRKKYNRKKKADIVLPATKPEELTGKAKSGRAGGKASAKARRKRKAEATAAEAAPSKEGKKVDYKARARKAAAAVAKKKAAGICIRNCTKPAVKGFALCPEHLKVRQKQTSDMRKKMLNGASAHA